MIFSLLWIARQAKKATIIGSGRLPAARPFWRAADCCQAGGLDPEEEDQGWRRALPCLLSPHPRPGIEPVYRQLAALRQEIVIADERVAVIRNHLDGIPLVPAEAVLSRRNGVEQHAAEALVRARRRREHHAMRAKVLAEEQQAAAEVRTLRIEEARLTEMIADREQILASRVRQLHEHTLRRCGTYLHHLVRKHPDGSALIRFLNLALPPLPRYCHPGTGPPGPGQRQDVAI